MAFKNKPLFPKVTGDWSLNYTNSNNTNNATVTGIQGISVSSGLGANQFLQVNAAGTLINGVSPAFAGDLAGSISSASLISISGIPIIGNPTQNGQVLTVTNLNTPGTLGQPTDVTVVSGGAPQTANSIYVVDQINNRVVVFSQAQQFQFTFGVAGSGNGQFNTPQSITSDSFGNIYVTDLGNYRIQKFTNEGVYLTQWGTLGSGIGQFNSPWGIACCTFAHYYVPAISGNFYNYPGIAVTDSVNNVVQTFDSFGNLANLGKFNQSSFAIPGTGFQLNGIDMSDDSANVQSLFITDSFNGKIQVISSGVGISNSYTSFGVLGSGNAQFLQPVGIDFIPISGNIGTIYVTDAQLNNVQEFSYVTSGSYLSTFGSFGNGSGEFNTPAGLSSDINGNIYVADQLNARIEEFTGSGIYVSEFGEPAVESFQYEIPTLIGDITGPINSNNITAMSGLPIEIWPTQTDQQLTYIGPGDFFNGINSIVVDSSGFIYVADGGNQLVKKYDFNLNYIGAVGNAGNIGNGSFLNPYRLGIDVKNNLYVLDNFLNSVQKFDSNGIFVRQWGGFGIASGQFNAPNGITVDTNNNIYVMDRAALIASGTGIRIQQFDTRGNILSSWTSATVRNSSIGNLHADTNNNLWVSTAGISGVPNVAIYATSGTLLNSYQISGGGFSVPPGGNRNIYDFAVYDTFGSNNFGYDYFYYVDGTPNATMALINPTLSSYQVQQLLINVANTNSPSGVLNCCAGSQSQSLVGGWVSQYPDATATNLIISNLKTNSFQSYAAALTNTQAPAIAISGITSNPALVNSIGTIGSGNYLSFEALATDLIPSQSNHCPSIYNGSFEESEYSYIPGIAVTGLFVASGSSLVSTNIGPGWTFAPTFNNPNLGAAFVRSNSLGNDLGSNDGGRALFILGSGTATSNVFPVSPNTTYGLEFQCVQTNTGIQIASILFYDGAGSQLSSAIPANVPVVYSGVANASWNNYGGLYTAPSNAYYGAIKLSAYNIANAGGSLGYAGFDGVQSVDPASALPVRLVGKSLGGGGISVTAIVTFLNTLTVTHTAHGYKAGDLIAFTSNQASVPNGLYTISLVPTVNTYIIKGTFSLNGSITSPTEMFWFAGNRCINPTKISNVVRNSTGNYTITFTIAQVDSYYSINVAGSAGANNLSGMGISSASVSTGGFSCQLSQNTGANFEEANTYFLIDLKGIV